MADWAHGARRTAHDVRLPAGETGPRHDNAVAESFLGTFKNETCHPRSFATRKEARLASAGYVEGYHDRRRPHSTIDYHIPERRWTHSSSAWTRWSRERRRCHWRHDYGPLAVRGVETVHWASLDEWGAELPGGRDAGAGGLWAGLEGLCGPEGGWSAGPRAYSPASRAFLSPDPEAPDASDPATAAAYAYAGGSPLSMVDPSGGRATPAQGGWDEQSWRATQARRAVAAGVRDVAEFAGILDRHTESYSELVCGVIARGQRTTYTVNPHGVLNVAGMIPGPVGFAADIANTGLYVWEGDWAGAGMSAAPRVFDIFRAGRAASSSTRFASRGDDMARAATRGEGFASRTWSRAKSAFRSFRDEVGDFAREVAGSESGAVTPRFVLPFGEDVARAAKKVSKFASHGDDVAGAVANSRRAAFRQAKRDLGIPVSRQPDKVHKVIKDRHGKVIPGGRGYQFNTGVIIGENGSPKVLHRDIFDHPNGHVFPDGGRVGPHFNTQVVDKDKVTWGKEHYWYGKGT